jgi:hypothetical protein
MPSEGLLNSNECNVPVNQEAIQTSPKRSS